MRVFSKESLESLRQRIDLIEVLSTHVELKRAGAAYKALCPFHDEKTPSFVVQKGDSHYHCFGCGAHGDAIHFLMAHLKISFLEAVESLAQRFHVPLEVVDEGNEKKEPNKAILKEALELACHFYQFWLLHTQEGHEALQYLYRRGIDLEFIRRFRLGLAPRESGVLRKVMHAKFIKDEILMQAGLLSGQAGKWRDFFLERITFPICDPAGRVIGFSARKYKETTFGGKYINTAETSLFKKSRILFGLNYSRRRIAKERKAIIVEGQIDTLRLINTGFNITVAGQGTAFGEGHVKELLALGLNEVYLAMDSDEAGRQATCKIGNLFQAEGVEVKVIKMPSGNDPDTFLREYGPKAFLELMHKSIDYLQFAISILALKFDGETPAGKNTIVQTLVQQIRGWRHPLMIHESLRKLAQLMRIPEDMVGVGQEHMPNIYIKKSASIGLQTIDPDRILEGDFLRWLLLMGQAQPQFFEAALANISVGDLRDIGCQRLYQACLDSYGSQSGGDALAIAIRLGEPEGQLLLSELLQKKVKPELACEQFLETIQRILDRNWMEKREQIKMRIQSGQCSEDEVMDLVKAFEQLKRTPPQVNAGLNWRKAKVESGADFLASSRDTESE